MIILYYIFFFTRRIIFDKLDINYCFCKGGFRLNKYLNINLSRKHEDLDFSDSIQYPFFEWFDDKKLITWNLVSNSCKVENKITYQSESLFSNPQFTTKTHFLIPEYQKVNYFLKITEEHISQTKLKFIYKRYQA